MLIVCSYGTKAGIHESELPRHPQNLGLPNHTNPKWYNPKMALNHASKPHFSSCFAPDARIQQSASSTRLTAASRYLYVSPVTGSLVCIISGLEITPASFAQPENPSSKKTSQMALVAIQPPFRIRKFISFLPGALSAAPGIKRLRGWLRTRITGNNCVQCPRLLILDVNRKTPGFPPMRAPVGLFYPCASVGNCVTSTRVVCVPRTTVCTFIPSSCIIGNRNVINLQQG